MLVTGLMVGSLLFAGCEKATSTAAPSPTPRTMKPAANVNQEPIANRPFVQLSPRADGHAVEMTLVSVKKSSTDMQYEIEYNSGSLLQGAFGDTSVDQSKLPLAKEILLGSCSTGGKCTYNTDVTGGTLTLQFGNPDFAVKNDWSFAEVAGAQGSFVSRDGRFTLSTTSLRSGEVIIFQSPGYPGTLTGTVISGPYTVGLASTLSGTVTIGVRVPAGTTGASLMGWDGKVWKELSSKLSTDGQLTATGALLQAYVVVGK